MSDFDHFSDQRSLPEPDGCIDVFSEVQATVNPQYRQYVEDMEDVMTRLEEDTGVTIKFSKRRYILVGNLHQIGAAKAILEEMVGNVSMDLYGNVRYPQGVMNGLGPVVGKGRATLFQEHQRLTTLERQQLMTRSDVGPRMFGLGSPDSGQGTQRGSGENSSSASEDREVYGLQRYLRQSGFFEKPGDGTAGQPPDQQPVGTSIPPLEGPLMLEEDVQNGGRSQEKLPNDDVEDLEQNETEIRDYEDFERPLGEEILVDMEPWEYMQERYSKELEIIKSSFDVDIKTKTDKSTNCVTVLMRPRNQQKIDLNGLFCAREEFANVYQHILLDCTQEICEVPRQVPLPAQLAALAATKEKYSTIVMKQSPRGSSRYVFIGPQKYAKQARHSFMEGFGMTVRRRPQTMTQQVETSESSGEYEHLQKHLRDEDDDGQETKKLEITIENNMIYANTQRSNNRPVLKLHQPPAAETGDEAYFEDMPDLESFSPYTDKSKFFSKADTQMEPSTEPLAEPGVPELTEQVEPNITLPEDVESDQLNVEASTTEANQFEPLTNMDFPVEPEEVNNVVPSEMEQATETGAEMTEPTAGKDEDEVDLSLASNHPVIDANPVTKTEHADRESESTLLYFLSDQPAGRKTPVSKPDYKTDDFTVISLKSDDPTSTDKAPVLRREEEDKSDDIQNDLKPAPKPPVLEADGATATPSVKARVVWLDDSEDDEEDQTPVDKARQDPSPERIVERLRQGGEYSSQKLIDVMSEVRNQETQNNVPAKNVLAAAAEKRALATKQPDEDDEDDDSEDEDKVQELPKFVPVVQQDGTVIQTCSGKFCSNCVEPMVDTAKLECGHEFCATCIRNPFRMVGDMCPKCGHVFQREVLPQPADGKMTHLVDKKTPLPTFPKHGSLMISFEFPSGKVKTDGEPEQKPKPYRKLKLVSYLPNNSDGRTIFKKLHETFQNRKLFSVLYVKGTKGVISLRSGVHLVQDKLKITKEYMSRLSKDLNTLV